VLLIVAPGFFISISLAAIEGIIAYAYYDTKGCDPLASKQIANPNQVRSRSARKAYLHSKNKNGSFIYEQGLYHHQGLSHSISKVLLAHARVNGVHVCFETILLEWSI